MPGMSDIGHLNGGSGEERRATSDAALVGHRPLVLVIEDEPTQRGLLTRLLESEGYNALGVGNGDMGLRAIVEYAPQMVLLDLSLPGMDGFEICRKLRSDPLTATLPVIAHRAMSYTSQLLPTFDRLMRFIVSPSRSSP